VNNSSYSMAHKVELEMGKKLLIAPVVLGGSLVAVRSDESLADVLARLDKSNEASERTGHLRAQHKPKTLSRKKNKPAEVMTFPLTFHYMVVSVNSKFHIPTNLNIDFLQ
jgi:hypothetical protein